MKVNDNRIILHCDLNSYFASVEALERPELRGLPLAVCGSVEARHGVVLARSEQAKKYGVRTAQTVWEARKKCPSLVIVSPRYDKYALYSGMVKDIYRQYTDRVESFGIDEAWLDVTGSRLLFGGGEKIAYEIKDKVKKEIGLTLSVGVSFCKVFSKLGSDLRKPDAVTCISGENFREMVWPLPASCIIGVGRSAVRKLSDHGIHTIGQIASYPMSFFDRIFGLNGKLMWAYANGLDNSEVLRCCDAVPMKSVSHGNTALSNLENNEEARLMLFELAQDVARRLRLYRLQARRLQVGVRDCKMGLREYQGILDFPTQSYTELAAAAYRLFTANYGWELPVRAMTVRAINLESDDIPYQTDIFTDFEKRERTDALERAVEAIRERYGRGSIEVAALLGHKKIPVEGAFDYGEYNEALLQYEAPASAG